MTVTNDIQNQDMGLTETDNIIAKAQANDTYMKAPNGQPTNLTERQWTEVRTQAFKEWFGDWEKTPELSSKIVDNNGEPLVMYHGTDTKFEKFDMHPGSMGTGVYFSSSWDEAAEYSIERQGLMPDRDAADIPWDDAIVIETYLNIRDRNNITHSSRYNNEIEVLATSPEQIKSATANIGTFAPDNENIRYHHTDKNIRMKDTINRPSTQEQALTAALVDHLRRIGLDVIIDMDEGQKVLTHAKTNGIKLRSRFRVNSLEKAANSIRSWIKGHSRGKIFTIYLPQATQEMIKAAIGKDFDSHNITANSIAHIIKNPGLNGNKLNVSSIPLLDRDLELIPYIMTAPDYIKAGSSDVTGRQSVRFYKELSNEYVVVVEKEYKNSPNDMETITMWAETSSKATNAQLHAAPDTHVLNAILGIDSAKIRKDAETAIENDIKNVPEAKKGNKSHQVGEINNSDIRHSHVPHGARLFKTPDGDSYGFTVGGKIYIDPTIAESETPIHEYSHLWATAMRQNNPKEWENIVVLMKDCPMWNEVRHNYPELTEDDELADEVLAHYSGSRGAALLREIQNKFGGTATGIIATFQSAMEKFWKSVSDMLGIHYTSAEQVADQVMTDLIAGKNVNALIDQAQNTKLRFSESQDVDIDTADDIDLLEENTRIRYARVAPTPHASSVYAAKYDPESRDNTFTLKFNKVNVGSKVLDIKFLEGLFIKKQTSTMPVGKPWPDNFPIAAVHTTQEKIYKDFGKEFEAAKAGNMEAARTIVAAVIKQGKVEELAKTFPNAIVAFPNKGKEDSNKLPAAYAELLGNAGLTVDTAIKQVSSPHHTGAADLLRLFLRARFEGDVIKDGKYIVIDDRLSSGGTVRDLKDYIESKGGTVVAVSALTCSRGGTLIAQNDAIRKTLKELHITDKQLQDYGIASSKGCLTNEEARRLARLSKFGVERVSKKAMEARPEYKVIIAGGRHFDNYELLKEKCDYLLQDKSKTHRIIVVSGKSSGADALGERYAAEKGYKVEGHPADWKKHGRAAGPIRNEEMAKVSDALIAFWDGESRGTKSMINLGKKHGLAVTPVMINKILQENHWRDKTEAASKYALNKAIFIHPKMEAAQTVYNIPEAKWQSPYPNRINQLYRAIDRYGEIEVPKDSDEFRTALAAMKLTGNTDFVKAMHKTVGSTSIYFILPNDYDSNMVKTQPLTRDTRQEEKVTETVYHSAGRGR